MDALYPTIGLGMTGTVGLVLMFGMLHYVVGTKTGYRPFTRQKLTLLSIVAALYHGAFYLQDQTVYLAGKPWAFPAMIVSAALLGGLIVLQNIRKAGLIWGAAVTSGQSLILVVFGPMYAALLILFVLRGLTKDIVPNDRGCSAPAPQPNFFYPNNMPY